MTTREKALTAIIVAEGWIVGLATENEDGYQALNYGPFKTESEAKQLADRMNEEIYGHTRVHALLITLSSMNPMSEEAHAKRRAEWPDFEAKAKAKAKAKTHASVLPRSMEDVRDHLLRKRAK